MHNACILSTFACKTMPSIQIRDVPKEIHDKLVEAARKERRSLSQQTLYFLEKALLQEDDHRTRRNILLNQISKRKPKLPNLPDPTELIRKDRDQ